MHGVLIIDKPAGMTSAEVVRRVKQRLRCKTGHLGTLDPFATGVLPLCLGEGTKIAMFLNQADKEYAGTIRLGSATETGDLTGKVVATAAVPQLTAAQLEAAAQRFVGESLQTPPMYSAIKQQGTPLYKLARQGISVERQPRRIHMATLQLKDQGDGVVGFRVSCSKGTYVRVLAEDIAAALGSVGHLETLRRLRFGRFHIAEAVTLEALDEPTARVIGLRDALGDLREIRIDALAAQRARQGYAPVLAALTPGARNETAKLVGPDDALSAVITADQVGRWRFARVFAADRAAPR
ncbi:MAG: tRNA pseudouridine(55) synthase TruB [Candidatus Binatia bacterium]